MCVAWCGTRCRPATRVSAVGRSWVGTRSGSGFSSAPACFWTTSPRAPRSETSVNFMQKKIMEFVIRIIFCRKCNVFYSCMCFVWKGYDGLLLSWMLVSFYKWVRKLTKLTGIIATPPPSFLNFLNNCVKHFKNKNLFRLFDKSIQFWAIKCYLH